MRHLTAAQRGNGGGWHYVSLGRDGGYPLGYCLNHGPHETEAAARECYGRYQRDHIRLASVTFRWTSCDVAGCDQPTTQGADIADDGYSQVALCPTHMTVDRAAETLGITGPAGDSWRS